MERKAVSGIVLALLLTGLLAMAFKIPPVRTETGTITVPDDYAAIQEAINNANIGDTIYVRNGTYHEHVVVNKTVSLIGENRTTTVVDGDGTGVVIHITATDVTARGLTIRNGSSGLLLHGVTNTTILDAIVTSNRWIGIYMYGSNNNTISANRILNNSDSGITCEFSSGNNINGNKITNNKRGLYILSSHNNTIGSNNITMNEESGILFESSNSNIIDGNLIYRNPAQGIEGEGFNNTLSNNSVTYSDYGIKLSGGNNRIFNNNVTDTWQSGLHLWGSNNVLLNNTITPQFWGWDGLYISGDNNTVGNNRITGVLMGWDEWEEWGAWENGMMIRGSNNTVFSNNVRDARNMGIYLEGGSENTIYDNIVVNNAIYGIRLIVQYGSNNIVERNSISSSSYGIRALLGHQSYGNIIRSNNVIDNEYGIYIRLTGRFYPPYDYPANSNAVSGNNVTGNNYGIYLHDQDRISYNNVIDGNAVSNSGYGIYLDGSRSNTVRGNVIANSAWSGIYLYDSESTVIVDNNITDNVFGLRLESSSNNRIYHNNFLGNAIQAGNYPEDKVNTWDNSYPSAGNFWSDYTGVDEKSGPNQDQPGSDGVGDTPYPILAGNQDRYPLMRPWTPPTWAPTIYVDPSPSEATVGKNFTININIAGVENLYAYEFKLFFNTTLLNTADIKLPSGHFLTPEDPSKIFIAKQETDDNYNATHGRIWLAVTLLAPEEPKTGSGTLVAVTFDAVTVGEDLLDLNDTMLMDSEGTQIPHSQIDGYAVSVEIEHDTTVLDVSPSAVKAYVGEVIDIAVTVRNLGNVVETFNVTAYFDNVTIGILTVLNLPPGQELTLTFSWNTSGIDPYVNYTIRAEASVVSGEANTANNVFIDGSVKLKIMGDINDDRTVDIRDVVIVAIAYGSRPGDPNWDPNADVNHDGKVDLYDLVLVAVNFGNAA